MHDFEDDIENKLALFQSLIGRGNVKDSGQVMAEIIQTMMDMIKHERHARRQPVAEVATMCPVTGACACNPADCAWMRKMAEPVPTPEPQEDDDDSTIEPPDLSLLQAYMGLPDGIAPELAVVPADDALDAEDASNEAEGEETVTAVETSETKKVYAPHGLTKWGNPRRIRTKKPR